MAPFPQTTVPAHKREGAGRPSEYRSEYCDLVIERMADGDSLSGFAGFIRVSREAVYSWIRAHAEFADAVARARSARIFWWEQKLKRSRKGAETSASIFALKNADPTEWRDIRYSEHKHSVSVQSLTDAQLFAIAAGVSPADAGVIEGEATRLAETSHTNDG